MMNARLTLKLYTTSHCHLCELALELVLLHCKACAIALVEIADNENLLSKYGTRIPVLQRTDTLAELGWPFNENDLQHFLKP